MKHASPQELWQSIESTLSTQATTDTQTVTSTGNSPSEPLALGIDLSRSQPCSGRASSGSTIQQDAGLPDPVAPTKGSADGPPASNASYKGAAPVAASPAAILAPDTKADTTTIAHHAEEPRGTSTLLQAKPKNSDVSKNATVGRSSTAGTEDKATGGSPFREHEPSDDPVDPALILTEISALIRRYIILEPEQADAAALWVAHTHMIEVAGHSPILIVNAPERACGKTLVQDVLGRFAYRALHASNASLSAMFRSIELWGVTLMIDEADTFFRDSPELHGMVNAGHKRGGTLLRSEAKGDSFEPKAFSVYGAKSIAGIALERHLPDATMSRGIVIGMRRKRGHENVDRLRHADDRIFGRLASQLVRFAGDYAEQIGNARPELPDQLSDRAQDNWEPLLAIAMSAGDEWFKRATDAALKLSVASEAQAGAGNDLLADIRDVLKNRVQKGSIPTADLIEDLLADVEMGWNTYNRGKPLTPRQLAKMLDVYQIHPKTVRQHDGRTPKGYALADFEDAFARYLKVPAEDEVVELPSSNARPGPPLHVAATAQRMARGGVVNTSNTPIDYDDDSRY